MKIYQVILSVARYDNEPVNYDEVEFGNALEKKLDGDIGVVSVTTVTIRKVDFPDPAGDQDKVYEVWMDRADAEMAL